MRKRSVEFPAVANEPVRARHIAIYHTDADIQLYISEFEAFGTGMYIDDTLHHEFKVGVITKKM